ncbi:glycerophosphodiester phosphodiesterase [Vibrio galatheae]|uniref:Glycerophosphodiester phosphodiesterase n=1 Tax=Vibrio galatheae TaxID=579748 RepID=A0A0F4NFD5_9VIBR|nr:glycerophosphodiester phosphodiesterase [Vibrio galatheae]
MIIVGHRGVAGRYPENTRASIEAAIELGLNWVEVDVQPTKDGHLVICHDHRIDRCSNGKGRIDSMNLEELQGYDFGAWFDDKFTGEPILTLGDLLELSNTHDLKLNLELKIDRHDPQSVCQLLKHQLEAHNITPDQIVLSSFNHELIRQLHRRLPNFRLGVLCERLNKKTKALLKEVGAYSCNIHYRWANRKLIERLHAEGFQVWSYTVNNPSALTHLTDLDAIFSDYPERFLPW